MIASGQAAPANGKGVAADWFGIACHGHAITHLDSLGHVFWDGKMYGGRPAEEVNELAGARSGSIEDAGGGIVTRGVLLDLPRVFDVDYLSDDVEIGPADLELAETRLGVTVGESDALLVRVRSPRAGPGSEPAALRGCTNVAWHFSAPT